MIKKMIVLLIVSIIIVIVIKLIPLVNFSSSLAYTIQHDMGFKTDEMYEIVNGFSNSDSLLMDSLLESILKSHDNFWFIDVDSNMLISENDNIEEMKRKEQFQFDQDMKRMKNPIKTYKVNIGSNQLLFFEKIFYSKKYNSINAYGRSCYFFNFYFFIIPLFCSLEWSA
jgi:hypothetical protein